MTHWIMRLEANLAPLGRVWERGVASGQGYIRGTHTHTHMCTPCHTPPCFLTGMPYLSSPTDYRAWQLVFWFWLCSEWKLVLYYLDVWAVRMLISFTGVNVFCFFFGFSFFGHWVSMNLTLDYVIEFEGKRLSLFSVTESGRSAVSSLCFQAAPLNKSCTFSVFCSSFYPLLSFPDLSSPQLKLCWRISLCVSEDAFWKDPWLSSVWF